MRKVVVITPPDAAYGFHLAGVMQRTSTAADIESLLEQSVQDPETALIVMDERLSETLSEEKMERFERRFSGVLVVLPSPERPEGELEDYAARLIRKAIGYHVRIRA